MSAVWRVGQCIEYIIQIGAPWWIRTTDPQLRRLLPAVEKIAPIFLKLLIIQ